MHGKPYTMYAVQCNGLPQRFTNTLRCFYFLFNFFYYNLPLCNAYRCVRICSNVTAYAFMVCVCVHGCMNKWMNASVRVCDRVNACRDLRDVCSRTFVLLNMRT